MPGTTKTVLFGVLALALACGGDPDPSDGGSDAAHDDAAHDDGTTDDGTAAALCDEEDRDEDFALGLAHEGETVTVTIADAEPAMPIRGDNAWTLMITDAEGAAMEGMLLDIGPWMPDHGHGSPIESTTQALGEGQYRIERLNLFMAGYWEITIGLADGQGVEDEVVFKVCVE